MWIFNWKNVSSSLPAFLGRQVNFTFEKSEICIENSIKHLTSKHFSIQFSIENHSNWQPWSDKFLDTKKNGLLFMEFGKQKSGEERIMEQSTSETVCFAWGSRFCSFLRHKNKPSPQSFGDWFLPILRDWAMQKRKESKWYRKLD